MSNSTIAVISGLSLEIPGDRILFTHLNFTLDSKLTALVGPNGVGKTCLAKVLMGEVVPTSGTVRKNGVITFLPQREQPTCITVDKYLSPGYTWNALGEKLLEGIDRQLNCTELSGGQWMRVRLANSLDESYLILDEPTNDLDWEGRKAVLQFLRQRKERVLLISHDRECLQICDEVLELSSQGLEKFGGGWQNYETAKNQQREKLQSSLASAKKDREKIQQQRNELKDRQEKRNRRGQVAAKRGGMPKILIGARKRNAQVTTGNVDSETLALADRAVGDAFQAYSALKVDPVMYADLAGKEIPNRKLVAEAIDFNVRFQNWIYAKDLNFTWRGNIRLAIKGKNGSGKSTLVKSFLGQSFRFRGELRHGQLNTLYIDQKCAVLDDSKTLMDNIKEVSTLDLGEIRNGLAKFLFFKESVFQKVDTLSGGERIRAALARGLLNPDKPELLVLDEPTNNLDLLNIRILENLVKEFRGAVVIISHDEVFLKNCGVTEEYQLG